MKLFLVRSLAFIVPLIFVGVALEVALRRIPNDYSYKRDYLDKNSRKVNVLFLGSSHTYYGIDPSYSKNPGFNASYVSQSLHYDRAILKKYEGKWDQLEYIVLAVDYFSLYNNLAESVENWRVKNYNIYWGIGEGFKLADQFELLGNQAPITFNKLNRYYFQHESNITSSELGRGPVRPTLDDNKFEASGQVAAKRHTYDLKHFNDNLTELKSIVEFAESNNIKVILYTTPADESYYTNLDNDQKTRNIRVLTQLDSAYDNVRYINLMENPRFVRSDFWDPDHLNESGAKKLTMMLDSLISL